MILTPRRRLVVAAGLLVAWLGWLGYLVVKSNALDQAAGGRRMAQSAGDGRTWSRWVLSRPQFLAADWVVIVTVNSSGGKPDAKVTVQNPEGVWARDPSKKVTAKEILIKNLSDCENWIGPGEYILPVVSDGDDYRVVRIPPSPGYAYSDPPRIYRVTEETSQQLREMLGQR